MYLHGQGITHSRHRRGHTYNGQSLCQPCCNRLHGSRDNNTWRPSPFDVACVSYDRIGSKRKFGVEIETSRCSDYRSLLGRTKFGAKHDPTVSGMEFDSPILYGDEGLEYIGEFLVYGNTHDWAADSGCGCHTHYDMRDESRSQFLSIAYACRKTQSLWEKFVPSRRSHGSYSHTPQWNLADFRRIVTNSDQTSMDAWISRLDCERYERVNYIAYFDHCTIEVRSLEGTVNPDTICNWITINCRFMDAVRDMSWAEIDDLFSGDDFEGLSTLIGDDDLIGWLKSRMLEFGHTPPVTAADIPF